MWLELRQKYSNLLRRRNWNPIPVPALSNSRLVYRAKTAIGRPRRDRKIHPVPHGCLLPSTAGLNALRHILRPMERRVRDSQWWAVVTTSSALTSSPPPTKEESSVSRAGPSHNFSAPVQRSVSRRLALSYESWKVFLTRGPAWSAPRSRSECMTFPLLHTS